MARRGVALGPAIVAAALAAGACTLAPTVPTGPTAPPAPTTATTADAPRLTRLGVARVNPGTKFEGRRVGGWSGVEPTGEPGRVLIACDDPREPRLIRATIDTPDGGAPPGASRGGLRVRVDGTVPLGLPAGTRATDPEGVRRLADGSLVWVGEGSASGVPTIVRCRPDGSGPGAWPLPTGVAPGSGIGVERNRSFESVAAWGDRVVVATESPLRQDRARPGATTREILRLFEFEASRPDAGPTRTWAYALEPLPEGWPGSSVRGLTDLVALSPTRLIALERAWDGGLRFRCRLFLVDPPADAPPGRPDAPPDALPVASKTLLGDLTAASGVSGNFEGLGVLASEPGDPPGSRRLVLVSDNNFHALAPTLVVLLRADGVE